MYSNNLLEDISNSLFKCSSADPYNYTDRIDDGIEQVYHTVMTDFNKSLSQR